MHHLMLMGILIHSALKAVWSSNGQRLTPGRWVSYPLSPLSTPLWPSVCNLTGHENTCYIWGPWGMWCLPLALLEEPLRDPKEEEGVENLTPDEKWWELTVGSTAVPHVGNQELSACNKAEGERLFQSFHFNISNCHSTDVLHWRFG